MTAMCQTIFSDSLWQCIEHYNTEVKFQTYSNLCDGNHTKTLLSSIIRIQKRYSLIYYFYIWFFLTNTLRPLWLKSEIYFNIWPVFNQNKVTVKPIPNLFYFILFFWFNSKMRCRIIGWSKYTFSGSFTREQYFDMNTAKTSVYI